MSKRVIRDEKISQAKFVPLLNRLLKYEHSSFISFNHWWESVVIVDKSKRKFKRRDIILDIANTDGGAHVDKEIKEDYAQLSRNNSTGWSYVIGHSDGTEESHDMKHVELFTLRQIAFEVISSIQKYL